MFILNSVSGSGYAPMWIALILHFYSLTYKSEKSFYIMFYYRLNQWTSGQSSVLLLLLEGTLIYFTFILPESATRSKSLFWGRPCQDSTPWQSYRNVYNRASQIKAYMLFCQELDEKIDATVMFVR